MKITKHFFLLILIFSCSYTYGQESDLLTSKQMEKDLDMLVDFLNVHPDPFTNITEEEEYLSVISEVRQTISDPMDLNEFYQQLARVPAALKDGHTSLSMPEDWLLKSRKQFGVFPFEVIIQNDQTAYITKSLGSDEIPKGAQITAINSKPISEILSAM